MERAFRGARASFGAAGQSADDPGGRMASRVTPTAALWALRALGCGELLAVDLAAMFADVPSTALIKGWIVLDADHQAGVQSWLARCGLALRVVSQDGDRTGLRLEQLSP